MNLLSCLKRSLLNIKSKIKENSFDSLVWLVNIVPNTAGFSIREEDKTTVWFWYIHLPLMFYIYGVGNFEYQWKYAQEPGDYIKSYVNISLMVLIVNNSWWFLMKRPLLISLLRNINKNDRMARRTSFLQMKHEKMMRVIKRIVLIFYGFNLTDAFFIYIPHRVDISGSYSMTPCVGLEPLTTSPKREICQIILGTQEITIMVVTLNFQALLLFLIAHTAVMYQMLSYEMSALDENKEENKNLAKDMLPVLISRHALTLDVVDKLQSLYSAPLGINFGSNAVCMSLFFYLPLQEWLQFMPILVYCFLVFFLYCFLCQRLINCSEVFERSVYCCGWENFDLREKKLVYMMLRQSQKPVELLAANIIPVNIYTFATTLQAMFKFVTVVKI